MIKVAIANDTIIALEALRRTIARDSTYELIWSAKDGAEAISRCAANTPDIMLMDLQMPGIDGVEATRQIMANSPCAILIVTASMTLNTSKVFEAMGYGALDVVGTPIFGSDDDDELTMSIAAPLLVKMATMTAYIGKGRKRRLMTGDSRLRKPQPKVPALPDLIAIGASTGGPKALAKIFSCLPANCRASVVVVQHIDRKFAQGLASWLNDQTPLNVAVAKEGDRVEPGQILIAGTDDHLVMKSNRTLSYRTVNQVTPYRPSVDVFFKSISMHWPVIGQAVLLTGMGRDGAVGMGLLHKLGWHTIAESAQSCVVYGMPRAAVELKAATDVLPARKIASALQQCFVK